MAVKFAKRMSKLQGSEIRELLKLTQQPQIISFAGGMPAPELFPVEEMKKVSVAVLDERGTEAMQYTTTEGYEPLRVQIAERMNTKNGTNVNADDILVTSGSQQGLDFAAKVFIDEGDVILCESPSYLGALNAFKSYEPNFIDVPTDENGMIMEELEKILATTDRIKMIYVIPDFQNPTGRTWPLDRRHKFMELINKYEIPVIEDNPYGELRFEGEGLPSLKSLDTKGLVIFLGTFSKIFCPGYRLGWTCAAPEILAKFNVAKQGADLQSSTISQMEASKFMDMYDLDAHVDKIKAVYVKRRDVMLKTMEEQFPEGVQFTHPEGGLFTWVILPKELNAKELMVKCLEKDVAYVAGGGFFPNGGFENTFRLNYSCMPEEKIVKGITSIGEVLKEAMGVKNI
ncbi:MAG: PLP-dependent aminotransferase family protein [Clostridioides sp.]|jgi:2-aminoadipate transaminase|nr:PLP-dependent aminotransferase family protein [Clostridioides sp.]